MSGGLGLRLTTIELLKGVSQHFRVLHEVVANELLQLLLLRIAEFSCESRNGAGDDNQEEHTKNFDHLILSIVSGHLASRGQGGLPHSRLAKFKRSLARIHSGLPRLKTATPTF